MKGAAIFILLILMISSFVIAIGTSTISSEENNTTDSTNKATTKTSNVSKITSQIREKVQNKTNSTITTLIASKIRSHLQLCENNDNRTERIKCRLKIREIASKKIVSQWQEENKPDNIPEACRKLGVDSKARCRALYQKSKLCYEKQGRERDKCFKRVIGFTNSNLNDQRSEKAEKGRQYLVLLLYDLQERIEEKVESTQIDEETGANLIAQIVEIKELILNNGTRTDIAPKINEFKLSYRKAIA